MWEVTGKSPTMHFPRIQDLWIGELPAEGSSEGNVRLPFVPHYVLKLYVTLSGVAFFVC